MKKIDRIKKKINNYLFDHYILKNILSNVVTLFFAVLAAFVFAFGFSCFVNPASTESLTIVTGGISGISQNIVLIFRMFGISDIPIQTIQSIFYFALNVPICIFAFFCVGKKFAIYTIINVGVSSLFIQFMPDWEVFKDIAYLLRDTMLSTENPELGGLILRVFFAAVCVGLSGSIAFRGGLSCGGIDVFSYYLSTKKSTGAGKFTILLNTIIVTTYNILFVIHYHENFAIAVISFLLAITYLFITAIIIDHINIRNKKVQIQIITSEEHMAEILISNFPHSATVFRGKGAYTQSDRYSIYMVVSTLEVNNVVRIAKGVDSKAFIAVTSLVQVYGNFFIKPVE